MVDKLPQNREDTTEGTFIYPCTQEDIHKIPSPIDVCIHPSIHPSPPIPRSTAAANALQHAIERKREGEPQMVNELDSWRKRKFHLINGVLYKAHQKIVDYGYLQITAAFNLM